MAVNTKSEIMQLAGRVSSVIPEPRMQCAVSGIQAALKLFSLITIAVCCLVNVSFAAQNVYQFTTPEQQKTFYSVVEQTRCLVCQNETLLDSQAPLANDLRQDIYQQVLAGQNQQQILQYLTNRYGEFVLFKPKFELKNYLLWLLPFVLLLALVFGLIRYKLKQRSAEVVLTEQQKQQLKKLLEERS